MPKMATKAADSVWYQARMEASAWNDRLKSREGASEVTGIDRTRLAYIELGTVIPHPDEALMLSDVYNAPELCNHFCSTQCPPGPWESGAGSDGGIGGNDPPTAPDPQRP